MSASSTSGLSVIESYCYELSTLNKVYFTLLYFTLPSDPQKSAIQESFPSNPDLLRFSSSCSSFVMSSFFPIVKTAVTSTLPGLKRESYFFEIT